MSAILSADDLNDFISPGVACIKPVKILPKQEEEPNAYEVTTEDKVHAEAAQPASISLTDCLACSGCVTSAEAVLISLQSHTEVLNTLDRHPSLNVFDAVPDSRADPTFGGVEPKLFVASVSPQVTASLAAAYQISTRQAGYMIKQFLSGPQGLRSGGQHGSGFTYVVDTNPMQEACLALCADEVAQSLKGATTALQPLLTSACPGWICYAEKTHPHVLPHLSRLKSPQAMTGTLLKSSLSRALCIRPTQIWHLAIMPCFDKKLEASREELTDRSWAHEDDGRDDGSTSLVRDVDCVITSRELLTLSTERGINLHNLPLAPLPKAYHIPFPDPTISRFLFPQSRRRYDQDAASAPYTEVGTSGGYLHHILANQQSLHPGSTIHTRRGRNADVVEYTLFSSTQQPLLKCARFYGFRNIQNLVRKLKPARASRLPGAVPTRKGGKAVMTCAGGTEYTYVEVMACPGGCTNGGGQIRMDEAIALQNVTKGAGEREGGDRMGKELLSQREWLRRVDSAYFSVCSDRETDDDDDDEDNADVDVHDLSSNKKLTTNTISSSTSPLQALSIHDFLTYWSEYTSVPLERLVYTSFRKVESDVGKKEGERGTGDPERIAVLAGSIGGGW